MDSRLKEEFLTCIICHEVFRDPVTLHCGHTICSQCVTAFTKTQQQAIAEQCIPCPHCRALTKVPDPQQPVEQWAGQIKTGFFVKGLIETFVPRENVEVMCSPCSEDGDKTVASVWCPDCDKALCKDCQKVHRRLMSSHSVSNLTDRSTEGVEMVDKKIMCEEHKDTVVDMMCQKCDIVVCPRCCIDKHKGCIDSVVRLTDAMPKIKSVLEKRESDLVQNIQTLQKEIPLLESQMSTLKLSCRETETDIDTYSMKVSTAVQTTLKEKLQGLKKEAMKQLQEDEVYAKGSLQMAHQNRRIVQEVLQSTSEMARYEVYKTIPRDEELSRLKRGAPQILKFMLKQNNEEVQALGTIMPIFDQRRSIGEMSKPVLVERINATLPNDIQASKLNNVIVIEIGTLTAVVVSDLDNSCVKCFYKEGSKVCNSYLQVVDPRGLTKIALTKVAVASAQLKQIVIFSVMHDHIVFDTEIATQKSYFDLCYVDPSRFVALGYHTGDVDIIAKSGDVLLSLCPGSFVKPGRVLITDPQTILIADTKAAHVRAITHRGESVFSYREHLLFPRGLAKSVTNEYFVVEGRAEKVIQFSNTGAFIREVLTSADGLQKPSGLFVDRTNKMYVATDTGYIYVYEFQQA